MPGVGDLSAAASSAWATACGAWLTRATLRSCSARVEQDHGGLEVVGDPGDDPLGLGEPAAVGHRPGRPHEQSLVGVGETGVLGAGHRVAADVALAEAGRRRGLGAAPA